MDILNRAMYELIYDDDVPSNQYYIDLFKKVPSRRTVKATFKSDITNFFNEQGFKTIVVNDKSNIGSEKETKIKLPGGSEFSISDKNTKILLINEEKRLMVILDFSHYKDENYKAEISVLYDLDKGSISSQLDLSFLANHVKEEKESSIKLIRNDNGYIDTEQFDLIVPTLDLELNYGEEFVKKHKVILETLNKKNSKGIVLLHGEAGTGKTTYIKYLTSLIEDKDILFVPPSMADILSEPSIIPFLIENSNSILLIEDGEKVISDRESNPSYASGVSNLLNMTDGILGDCLNIQVIVTFNMEREKIDKALLRNGRLISEHKFDALNITESNKLLKHLDKEYIATSPMTLADIYNVDSITYREKKAKIGMGFK